MADKINVETAMEQIRAIVQQVDETDHDELSEELEMVATDLALDCGDDDSMDLDDEDVDIDFADDEF